MTSDYWVWCALSICGVPERGRTGRRPETRELVFAGLPYLAVYRIGGDGVDILRILHGAHEWP